MKFRSSIMAQFGVKPKDWRGPAFMRAANNILEGIEDGLFQAVVGEWGGGKKTLMAFVIDQLVKKGGHVIIYLKMLDDTRVTIGQIMNAMIVELSDGSERPYRDTFAKKMQLAKLLGIKVKGAEKRKVTVVIEQSQHLHGNTIRALKELRELSFLGETELFGVVLIGHKSLRGKILALPDVADRVEFEILTEEYGWMNLECRKEYLKARFGKLLSDNMREQIALVYKTPLQMDRFVYDKMKEVFLRGDAKFKEEDFMLELKEIVKMHGLSYQRIADAIGYGKTTVARVINGEYDNPETINRVKEAVNRLIKNPLSQTA